jgi:hypothetical protein
LATASLARRGPSGREVDRLLSAAGRSSSATAHRTRRAPSGRELDRPASAAGRSSSVPAVPHAERHRAPPLPAHRIRIRCIRVLSGPPRWREGPLAPEQRGRPPVAPPRPIARCHGELRHWPRCYELLSRAPTSLSASARVLEHVDGESPVDALAMDAQGNSELEAGRDVEAAAPVIRPSPPHQRARGRRRWQGHTRRQDPPRHHRWWNLKGPCDA